MKRTTLLATVLTAIALIASFFTPIASAEEQEPQHRGVKTVVVINDVLPVTRIADLPPEAQPAAVEFAKAFGNVTFAFNPVTEQLVVGLQVPDIANGQPFGGLQFRSDCPNNSQFYQISPGHESPGPLAEKLNGTYKNVAVAWTRHRHPDLSQQPVIAFNVAHLNNRKLNLDVQLKQLNQTAMLERRRH